MTIKVVVVGAGIVGMTTAVRTLETVAHVDVTVVAEHFTPHTTGDVAAGFCELLAISGASDEKLRYGSYLISMPIECKKFLPYLMQRFQNSCDHFIERRLNQLKEHATVIGGFVGFRPGRDPLRIERENHVLLDGNKTFPVIHHNYGHGGSGVTLSWACAGEVIRLLEDVIRDSISAQ